MYFFLMFWDCSCLETVSKNSLNESSGSLQTGEIMIINMNIGSREKLTPQVGVRKSGGERSESM
jgi:hypothetical protein